MQRPLFAAASAMVVAAALLLSVPLGAATASAAQASATATRPVQAAATAHTITARTTAAISTRAGLAAPRIRPLVRFAVRHGKSPAVRPLPIVKPKTLPSAKPSPAKKSAMRKPAAPVARPKTSAGTAAPAGGHQAVTTQDVQTTNPLSDMPSFGENFDGITSDSFGVKLPPDVDGAVGPNDYVQAVGNAFRVYNKQGSLLNSYYTAELWQSIGGPCSTAKDGNESVLYDEQTGRWLISEIAYGSSGSSTYDECVAVSQTGDPTGAWNAYDFQFSSASFPGIDPQFGVWADGYYMSANDYSASGALSGVTVVAFDKAQMLAGQQAQDVSFTLGSQYASLQPSSAESGVTPPAGAPNPFFMSCDSANGGSCSSDQLDEWDFHADWATPANSTFGGNLAPSLALPVDAFNSNLCDYGTNCIPQPGTGQGLDARSEGLMSPAAYRNLGGTQAIVLNQTVNVSADPPVTNRAGVRWYELTDSGSGWTVAQQGTYAPGTDNRWMGSANIDASGDIALGYSVSSSSTYPSVAVAGRLAGDPAGQLTQGEETVITGNTSQTDPSGGWGGYSSMQVDPVDSCTFWYTAEYAEVNPVQYSTETWGARIGSFKFPGCTTGQHGRISGTVTDAGTGKPIAGATVTTSAGTTVTDAKGNYSLVLPAGNYNLATSDWGYAGSTASGVQVGSGATATENFSLTAKPFETVTGTVTDGSGQGWPLYASISIPGMPGGPVWTNPTTGKYTLSLPANASYTATVTASMPGYQTVTQPVTVAAAGLTQNIQVPVDESTCSAPGYQFNYGTPVMQEQFSGSKGSVPGASDGWTVTDSGNHEDWQIGDPDGHQNGTGGPGNFADISSYHYGNSVDASLVSPVLDLSKVPSPVVEFYMWYLDSGGQPQTVADVDVSTDGGQTWSTDWSQSGGGNIPALETVMLPQASDQGDVKIRFHYTGTANGWWEVSDVVVQARPCDAQPGGLVVGTVTDANTRAGVDGATITSADNSGTSATTAATSNDPNLPGGLYQTFYPLTGSHPFTATLSGYMAATQTVNVTAGGVTRADFSLDAPQLSVSAPAITSSQAMGTTTTAKLTITNTGTAPASFTLDKRNGLAQALTQQSAPLRLVRPSQPLPAGLSGKATVGGKTTAGGATSSTSPAWSSIAPYPEPIEGNATAFGDGLLYSFGGTTLQGGFLQTVSDLFAYNPDFNTWTQLASLPLTRDKAAVAFVNGKLYVTGGQSFNVGAVPDTDVYNPETNSWSVLAPNPNPTYGASVAVIGDTIYYVGGCDIIYGCGNVRTVLSYNTDTGTWSTLAAYPHAAAYASCGGINGKLYCAGGATGSTSYADANVYNPATNTWTSVAAMPIGLFGSSYSAANGQLVISGGSAGGSLLFLGSITNQGYAYDPTTNSWTALPNAPVALYNGSGACGFYTVGGEIGSPTPTTDTAQLSGFSGCTGTSLPWLGLNTTTATLQPGQSTTVTVTLAATTAAGVTQPGTFTAQIGVEQNTPYAVSPVNVTMTVTPPSGWGQVTGTVTGTSCAGVTGPVAGAQIQAIGKNYTHTATTNSAGGYSFWAPSAGNPYQVVVSKKAWVPKAATETVQAGGTIKANFTLSASC